MSEAKSRSPLLKINPHFGEIRITIDPFPETSVQNNLAKIREVVEKSITEACGPDFLLRRIEIREAMIICVVGCKVAFMDAAQFRRVTRNKTLGKLDFPVLLGMKELWPKPVYYVEVRTKINGTTALTD